MVPNIIANLFPVFFILRIPYFIYDVFISQKATLVSKSAHRLQPKIPYKLDFGGEV